MSDFVYNPHSHYFNHSDQSSRYPSYQNVRYPDNSREDVPYKKVKAWETPEEREKFENQAELYSLILTTEKLEKAFIKDAIKKEE